MTTRLTSPGPWHSAVAHAYELNRTMPRDGAERFWRAKYAITPDHAREIAWRCAQTDEKAAVQ